MGGAGSPTGTTANFCVGLHCHAAGSHRATVHLCGSLKQHWRGCQLHSNEQVEVAVREWLRITRARLAMAHASRHCQKGTEVSQLTLGSGEMGEISVHKNAAMSVPLITQLCACD